MKCPKCRAENRDDSKFWCSCAAPLIGAEGVGPQDDFLGTIPIA
jgi:hypothetical protein